MSEERTAGVYRPSEPKTRAEKIAADQCPECGGELDTGWECTACGFDAMPEAAPTPPEPSAEAVNVWANAMAMYDAEHVGYTAEPGHYQGYTRAALTADPLRRELGELVRWEHDQDDCGACYDRTEDDGEWVRWADVVALLEKHA